MSRKILIVDDEQHILDTVSAYLSREGYDVVVAHDGQQALFPDQFTEMVNEIFPILTEEQRAKLQQDRSG